MARDHRIFALAAHHRFHRSAKAVRSCITNMTPKAQLKSFMARFTPEVETLAQRILVKMRARFPSAIQMVYDNYNFLVIGFSPTERPSEAVFSIALGPRRVSLCFLQAASKLPDPEKLLRGSGIQVRNLCLEDATVLDRPAV